VLSDPSGSAETDMRASETAVTTGYCHSGWYILLHVFSRHTDKVQVLFKEPHEGRISRNPVPETLG